MPPATGVTWLGAFGSHVVRLSLDPAGTLRWSAPVGHAESAGPALARYFHGDQPLAELTDSLPWRSDAHLARCLAAFPGLRILRQPFGETLLCFLCSATKQIVQIRQMVALLAEKHGDELALSLCGDRSPQRGKKPPAIGSRSSALRAQASAGGLISAFALPTWAQLAEIPEPVLRACQLGFRARYIHQTALFLAAHPGWLEETEALPYAAAKERLCSLPGVGEKVADCVLLFGAGRLEAFPVDTWILKAMARRYSLDGWKPAQVAHFGRTHFGPYAGLAQQYLFSYERFSRDAKT